MTLYGSKLAGEHFTFIKHTKKGAAAPSQIALDSNYLSKR